MNKDFYNRAIPRSILDSPLSIHTKHTLFSYSVDEGSVLYKYHIPTREWKFYKNHSADIKFNYSMQVVVTDRNLVYFIGGAEDPDY